MATQILAKSGKSLCGFFIAQPSSSALKMVSLHEYE